MNELVFQVEEDTGGGFVARALGEAIFAQGETREQLLGNIRDAVRCHYGTRDRRPRVLRLRYVCEEVFALEESCGESASANDFAPGFLKGKIEIIADTDERNEGKQ